MMETALTARTYLGIILKLVGSHENAKEYAAYRIQEIARLVGYQDSETEA
jgi:ABC-type uncharacterized transport system permease subunit